MHEQVSDFLEFAGFGDVENVVAPIVQVVAGPAGRCTAPYCPRSHPDNATDFFGFGAAGIDSLMVGTLFGWNL